MPISKKKWFCEKSLPGKRKKTIEHCFSVDKLIFKGKTKFQDVFIFDNDLYGRILFLDGINQLSQKDEFIYHEIMVHPILFSHPNPKNVLIIGGGDGCILREVLKHNVKKVDLVELDEEFIKICKKHFASINKKSFSDKRVNVHIEPGQDFIKKYINHYDAIIVDCTNLEDQGLSSSLYTKAFYNQVLKSLTKHGVIITLGASFLDFNTLIKKIFKGIKAVFSNSVIYRFTVPSYHCGEYSFIAGSGSIDLEKINFKKIQDRFDKLAKKHEFKYYSPEIHKASMVLPEAYKIE